MAGLFNRIYFKSHRLLIFVTFWAQASMADFDQEVLQMMDNRVDIHAGESLFNSACVSCHGNKLQGGVGFNLRDELWVHGGTPSEILQNIQNGFLQAGMPGFSEIYQEDQLKQLVAFILSKREGFSQLEYKIYSFEKNTKNVFSKLSNKTPSKTGTLNDNLLNFELPEIERYVIEFEGVLHAPQHRDTQLFAMLDKRKNMEVEIDGTLVNPSIKMWMMWTWPLKRGQQKVTIRYSTVTDKKITKNTKLFVANKEVTQKIFALSSAGKNEINNNTLPLKADNQIVVTRKKIVDLPSYSVSIGFPEKINYAFNIRNCHVLALWHGEFLDVGPNVQGRGKEGSIILGERAFITPEYVGFDSRHQCQFVKYNLTADPVFYYRIGNIDYSLQISAHADKSIVFNYQLKNKGKPQFVSLHLPDTDKVSFSQNGMKIKSNKLTMNVKKQTDITFMATVNPEINNDK